MPPSETGCTPKKHTYTLVPKWAYTHPGSFGAFLRLKEPAADGLPNVPVFRQTRWESNVVVPLDKPAIIFSSDNVSDTGKTELELTATEIK